MKVMVVGPSDTRSKGGMATVIREMRSDPMLNDCYELAIHPSYIDGNLAVRLWYSAWAYAKFLLIYKKFDLIHIHVATDGSTWRKSMYLNSAKRSGKKVIVHVHGAEYMEFYNALSEKGKGKVVQFLKAADLVLALSEGWKQAFVDAFGLTNCEVLENGIDMTSFAAIAQTPGENPTDFAMMGRLGQRKGTYDLIKAIEIAARSVPEIRCFLAGDGEVEKVRALVKSMNLERNIEVLGWIDGEKKMELLKKVSTVVLPSYNEGLPMFILEGMAAGKAVVSTPVGAIPEVISPENGFLVEPGDAQALADALVHCCNNPQMIKEMARVNRKKIEEEFSMRRMHLLLTEYYEAIVGRGKPSRKSLTT